MENKKKDISSMLKDAVILFAITLISGLILGFVYQITKDPIAAQEAKAIQEACAAVFPGETGITFEETGYVPSAQLTGEMAATGVEVGTIFKALGTDGSTKGYVVETTSKEGYGGNIVIYVGISTDAMVNGVSILEIAETPGLGMNAEEVLVPQFAGKEAVSFTVTKSGATQPSEIDAITGATVTTDAFVNAVNGAVRVVCEELMEGGQ
ncbi:MAG: RnfABCDGE type electron transport complex subunit G [Lachnospiraceae bacterium]|nr:RnfABCDGE type electron transport complex subunit G [Lachnospiraceae bacterium]